MAQRQGHLRTIWILSGLAGLLTLAMPASSPAQADPAVAEDRSWVTRTLDRYFGNSTLEGEELAGKAVDAAEQYAEFAGLPIEVIIIHPTLGFLPGPEEGDSTPQQWFENLTKPFESYTQESIIRDYLLFKQGDLLDPFTLADTERLLREQEFIVDVRIVVVELADEAGDVGSVAVVVEPMDRFPLGVSGKIKTEDRYTAKLFTVNLFGLGTLFENEIIVNRADEPQIGYRGRLRQNNMAGVFMDGEIEFENSYHKRRSLFLLERQLVHPEIEVTGSMSFDEIIDRETESFDLHYIDREAWAGYIVPLYSAGDLRELDRPMLVPALRYTGRDFLNEPEIPPDDERAYQDRQLVLVGLSLIKTTYYNSSYFFGDGEIETLPSGLVAKLSGGYEWRDFEERVAIFGSCDWIQLRNRGDMIFATGGLGGYVESGRLEDGVLKLDGGYFTRLYGGGHWRTRFSGRASYTLGIGPYISDRIYLDDEAGIRGMPGGEVSGDQRLVGNLEARIFTPWAVFGFRASFMGFLDLGMIGDEKASSIFEEKVYASAGLGLRLRNPDLALPTVELRVLALNETAGSGHEFQFRLGSPTFQIPVFPSAKPGTVPYK